MATDPLRRALRHLHQALPPPDGLTDGQLLARFVARRDEAAFTALVRRHGPMVLGVCRRILRHTQDAEDAFQATFLVLARKAATVTHRPAVGSWLYRVSSRIALEARTTADRRRRHERQVEDVSHPAVWPAEMEDWRPWLDRELNRLPEKYRALIVTCDLEGRPHKEAARELGLAEGTVSSRLARGRRLLARRLARHGLSVSAGGLVAALTEGTTTAAPLPSTTMTAAVRLAMGPTPALTGSVEVLVKGALKTMWLAKMKWAVGAVMVVAVLGASGVAYQASGQSAPPEKKPLSEVEALRRENELLKLNLEVVLEKVRAQEAELRNLRAGKAQAERGKKPEPSTSSAKSQGGASLSREDLTRLENTLSALRSELSMWEDRANWSRRMSQPDRQYVTPSQAQADQARLNSAQGALRSAEMRLEMAKTLQGAEAALKSLKESPFPKVRERAADTLEKALRNLKEQLQEAEDGPLKP